MTDTRQQIETLAIQIDQLVTQGQTLQAIALAQVLLTLTRQQVPANIPALLSALNRLAALHERAGYPASAEPFYHEALELVEQIPGFSPDEMARARANLGRVTAADKSLPVDQSTPGAEPGLERVLTRLDDLHQRLVEIASLTAAARGAAESGAEPSETTGASMVTRHATVRYYRRMNPHRLYPLLIVLSRQQVQEIREWTIASAQEQGLQLSADALMDVEPVLPGCTCYPPRQQIPVDAEIVQARFQVMPGATGTLNDARIILRQEGQVVAEVGLDITVRPLWPVVVLGLVLLGAACALYLLPKYTETPSGAEGTGFFGLTQALFALQLAVLFGLVGGIAALGWAGVRIGMVANVEVAPSLRSRFRRAVQAFQSGRSEEGLTQLQTLLQEHPGCRAGWLYAGHWYFQNRRYEEAHRHFTNGLVGPADARLYAEGASAAARLGRHDQALGWLEQGLQEEATPQVRRLMLFNAGCYACRLGRQEEALRYLEQAVAAGLTTARTYREEPDLAALREHPDFQKLLTRL
jgi:Flp pilus assembly protein TadD